MSLTEDANCHKRLDSTTTILDDLNLGDACLVFDSNGSRKRHTISWTQWSRKTLGCSEVYWELDYNLENGGNIVPFRVFVAENHYNNGSPPSKIRIGNSDGRLYMAFFPIDYDKPKGDHAVVFVYQPSKDEDCREIYQKRFHMGVNNLVEIAIGAAGGAAAGAAATAAATAAAGAALGSVVPGPGTALGAAVGAAVGVAGVVGSLAGGALSKHFTNNYTGHFLRFVS